MVKLSIIIPVYNEEKTLKEIVEKVIKVDLGNVEKEIIIIDDYSKDNSSKIILNLKKKYKNIGSFTHERNKGKGAAVKTGLRQFSGDIVVIQDSDLEYDPKDFKKMIKLILEGKTKVVYGSRFIKGEYKNPKLVGKNSIPLPFHYMGNKFLSFVTYALYGQKITDMETCYKMMSREVVEKMDLTSNNFDIEPEITSKIIKNKYKIIEVPIGYDSRTFEQGKKITWKDGLSALYTLIKYRFLD